MIDSEPLTSSAEIIQHIRGSSGLVSSYSYMPKGAPKLMRSPDNGSPLTQGAPQDNGAFKPMGAHRLLRVNLGVLDKTWNILETTDQNVGLQTCISEEDEDEAYLENILPRKGVP